MVREYADRPIGEPELTRILEAGRTTGSSQNRQMWRFHVLRDKERRKALAETAYAPENVSTCQVVVGLVSLSKSAFDIGRVAQNMMLAAWTEGIGSSPNGVRDMEAAKELLGIGAEESLVTILSLGYPLRPLQAKSGGEAGILARINRKPLDEVVVRVDER